MNEQWVTLIFNTVPQFGFAAFLFWMCSKNADKQREAYQAQILAIYQLAERMIETVDEVIGMAKSTAVSQLTKTKT